jgi:predicted methyltransferase MtxX (methanogen marker protein 4)
MMTTGTMTAIAIVMEDVLDCVDDAVETAAEVADELVDEVDASRTIAEEVEDGRLDAFELGWMSSELVWMLIELGVDLGVIEAEAAVDIQLAIYQSWPILNQPLTSRCDAARTSHTTVLIENALSRGHLRLLITCARDLCSDKAVVVRRAVVAEASIRCHARSVAAAK